VRRKYRIILILLCGFVLLAAIGAFVVYRASQHVPEAYSEALQGDPIEQREAGEQLERQVTALQTATQQPGQWEVTFTADQINGWLAEILPEKFSETLPDFLSDPRVAIHPDEMMAFIRFRKGGFSSVITLTIEPYVPEPNVLALRFHGIQAGAVPWRLREIVDGTTEAARQHDVEIEWRMADGEDPVARIRIAGLDKCELGVDEQGEGRLYLSGTVAGR